MIYASLRGLNLHKISNLVTVTTGKIEDFAVRQQSMRLMGCIFFVRFVEVTQYTVKNI